MVGEVRSFAKLVGPSWVYYMTKPVIVLGRGGKDVDCDVIVSSETAVSRRHFSIRFAPELQAFEVHSLSKNGILVNGEFVRRLSPPVLLRSQADIAFGCDEPMRISFLLPIGVKPSIKRREAAADRRVPLFKWIGEQLVQHRRLTAKGLRASIEKAHPYQLRSLGSEQIIASSIRHILTHNDHIFEVMDSWEVENANDTFGDSRSQATEVQDAFFCVRESHVSRFHHFVPDREKKLHRSGFPSAVSRTQMEISPGQRLEAE